MKDRGKEQAPSTASIAWQMKWGSGQEEERNPRKRIVSM
jgi:hypothetical protein